MKNILTVLLIAALIVIAVSLLRSRRSSSQNSIASQPDDGRLRIRDLTIKDIRSGQNWKAIDPNELLEIGESINLEDIHIEKSESFSEKDTIVYSCIFVTEEGNVSPLVLIKEVGWVEYGGDYCEMHEGKWRQLGLVPNPNAPRGTEYVANPLDQDPSFGTMDNVKDNYRAELKAGFTKWSDKL